MIANLAKLVSASSSYTAVKALCACLAASVLVVGVAVGVPLDPKPDSPPKKELSGKGLPGQDMPAKAPAKESTLPAVGKTDGLMIPDSFVYSGNAVGSDGKPIKGAKVWLHMTSTRSSPLTLRAETNAEGKFSFTVKRTEFPGEDDPRMVSRMYNGAVLATYPGSGPAWHASPMPADARSHEIGVLIPTLRLSTDDVPIEGRVLDLQGKPVASATARVIGVYRPNEVDLGKFHKTLVTEQHSRHVVHYNLTGLDDYELRNGQFDAVIPPVKSAADGKFTLRGLGRERVALVRIEGESIETRDVFVMTRPCEPLSVKQYKEENASFPLSRHTYYGYKFDHAAAPSRPIVGVVRESGTGRPISGRDRYLRARRCATEYDPFRCVAVADDRGRFKLTGVPVKPGSRIMAIPPSTQPFVRNSAEIPQPLGLGPIPMDLELRRGVWVTGRVVDRDTNKAVRAEVHYFALEDNPHAKATPDFRTDPSVRPRLDDGSFRLVALPGQGIVGIKIHFGNDQFVVDTVNRDKLSASVATKPLSFRPAEFLTYKLVEPTTDDKEVRCDFLLSAGVTVKGTVVGPDGQRLKNLIVAGENPWNVLGWKHANGEFAITGLRPGAARYVQAIDEKNKLAGAMRVGAEDKGPVELKLEAWGSVAGKLLNEAGEPLANATLTFTWEGDPDANVRLKMGFVHKSYYQTDKEGRFKLEGLVPGMTYNVVHVRTSEVLGYLARKLSVKSGETKDLGNVRGK